MNIKYNGIEIIERSLIKLYQDKHSIVLGDSYGRMWVVKLTDPIYTEHFRLKRVIPEVDYHAVIPEEFGFSTDPPTCAHKPKEYELTLEAFLPNYKATTDPIHIAYDKNDRNWFVYRGEDE